MSNKRMENQFPPFVCTGYTFDCLPTDKAFIHPAFSPSLDPDVARFCDRFGISIWDREKVFHALTSIKQNPEKV